MLLALFRLRIRIESEFSWVSGSDPDRNWESGSGSMQVAILVPRKRKT
jgi:hypothetical protein